MLLASASFVEAKFSWGIRLVKDEYIHEFIKRLSYFKWKLVFLKMLNEEDFSSDSSDDDYIPTGNSS